MTAASDYPVSLRTVDGEVMAVMSQDQYVDMVNDIADLRAMRPVVAAVEVWHDAGYGVAAVHDALRHYRSVRALTG